MTGSTLPYIDDRWRQGRRLTAEDIGRALPRLEKFCRRHAIRFDYYADEPDRKLRHLMGTIRQWIDAADYDYRARLTAGQREQLARRVWQRATREPDAAFALDEGCIVHMG